MKITVPYQYTESVIPFRCRLPRQERFEATINLTVHEVTSAEAPVAIVANSHKYDAGGRRALRIEYRLWRGKLWTLHRNQKYFGGYPSKYGPALTESARMFAARDHTSRQNEYQTRAQRRTGLRAWAAGILFIDGKRWEVSGEPRYVIMTFGLGHNHGLGHGTSLTTDTGYNDNIGRGCYVRCDQYETAVALATKIATDRGDTKALPIRKQDPTTFEILIPEAVRLRPMKEHGDGCAFINSVEAMIRGTPDAATAGLATFGLALARVTSV